MYSWTTSALVATLTTPPYKRPKGAPEEQAIAPADAIRNFLDRVYYQIRNLGRSPQERAINYAATNAFEVGKIYEQAFREEMELDSVEVTRSPISKPGTDCWDVSLMFFYPQRQVQTVRNVHRFTVDVADVVPSTVGPVRSWFIR